jgi:class 3 adenylate cyclase/tetratricopeptide (TPR) repeat protein
VDITAWLRGLDLTQYEQAFRDNHIGAELLPTLTEADLREIGVASLGHRRRLLAAIAALAGNAAEAGPHAPGPGAATPHAAGAAAATATDSAPAGPQAERRQLTVLFCDLVGSTVLAARLDPEDLHRVTTAYHRGAAEVIGRWGGYVARYMGDGVLAYFGHPQAQEDDPERAAGAGLELVEAVGRLAPPGGSALRARVGIATGLVVVGDVVGGGAEGGAQERGVVGEAPNLAARLQAAAEPDTVVIDAATCRLLGGLFECRELGPVAAKGFPADLRAWRVLRRGGAESRSQALHAAHGAFAPLVGRDEEVGLLLRRWEQAKGGEGRVVLLSGEPGIGKSRLAAELTERLAGEQYARLRYFCSPHHRHSPLFPVVGQIERTAGFDRDDSPGTRLAKLEALLAEAAATRRGDEVALVADLLGLPAGGHNLPPGATPQRLREGLLESLLALVSGLAARRPVLMLCEDAHWIDPTSLELMNLAVERIRRLRVLMLVTFRPEFRPPPWAGLPHVTALALGGLGHREAASLIGRAAGEAALPAAVVEEIVERAGGVPLFVEELTRAAVETGEDGAARALAAAPSPDSPVPAALYASLAARLDRLGPAREVAQIGAAIGREVPYELLAAVARRPEAELRAALDRLVEAGLLFRTGEPPRAVYLFKHALVQDAAYGTLLRARRRELHAGIARALTDLFPEAAEARPEILAHHCAQAGLAEEAAALWGKAGRRAIARSAMAEAVAHLRRALDLLPALPDAPARWRRELDLQTALGNALMAAAGYTAPETGRAYDRARVLCERLGDTLTLALVAIGQCSHHLLRAETEAALGVAEDLLRRAEREGSLEGRLAAHWLIGSTVFQTGDLGRGRAHLDVAAGILEEAGEGAERMAGGKHALVSVPASRGTVMLLLGRYDAAKAQTARALSEARRLERAHLLAHALGMAARHHALLDEETPRPLLDALGEVAAERDFPYWAAELLQHRGLALAEAGETREGLALVREGAARLDGLGAAWHAALALCLAAGLAGGEEGFALVEEASARLARTGLRFFDPEVHRVRGALLAAGGDAAGAEAEFAEAVRVAREQGARHWELRAATGLAGLWRDQGRRAEARGLLAPVHGGFAEELDVPDLRRARALLDGLG